MGKNGPYDVSCGEKCKPYAYTPVIVVEKEEERKIYEQCVETIDLKDVIQAVNNIRPEM